MPKQRKTVADFPKLVAGGTMQDEQTRKLSRFGWLTVATLFLIGCIRVGLHVFGVIRYIDTDEATRQTKSIETCKSFFGDGEQHMDG